MQEFVLNWILLSDLDSIINRNFVFDNPTLIDSTKCRVGQSRVIKDKVPVCDRVEIGKTHLEFDSEWILALKDVDQIEIGQ